MKPITFDDIYTIGEIVSENQLFQQYHYKDMLSRYDSNFIQFKQVPSVEEFIETADYLREFHKKHGQNHVKFYFPENEDVPDYLVKYLEEHGYDVASLELYAINPRQFPKVEDNPDIEIKVVTKEIIKEYLDFQYQQDLEYGVNFATQKIDLNKRQFEQKNIWQLLAFYKGTPAGVVDVIEADETAEIDGLAVAEEFRQRGIASRLQKFVMDTFPNKTVILVADGDDTPREMYQKQNYKYIGCKYLAMKVFVDKKMSEF